MGFLQLALEAVINKLSLLWEYCMENKKQSIIILSLVLLAFFILGYASLIVIAKLISFVFGLVISILGFYLSYFYVTIPITVAGYYYWQNRAE